MIFLRTSSRSSTKLPNPVDRTRVRNEIPRDGENCIRVPILFYFRFGPEKYSEWTRTDWGCERGELTRTHPHECPVKYSKSISGYLQRWLSLSVCRNVDEVYYISDVSLPAGSAEGDTFPSRRNGKRESQVQRGCELASEWKDSFTPGYLHPAVTQALRNN